MAAQGRNMYFDKISNAYNSWNSDYVKVAGIKTSKIHKTTHLGVALLNGKNT